MASVHFEFQRPHAIDFTAPHVFAFSDRENKDWYSLELGRRWKRMVIVAAAT